MPQRFGGFWLHEKIGHGGMAEVFRATIGPDPHSYAFDMALKRLHPHLQADKSQTDMFLTEADIAKVLRHPNIVQVYDSGLVDGQAFIAMEYIWGTDLATLIEVLRKRRLRFPSDVAVYVALQVLRALDYVHNAATPAGQSMDMVHRDVTPSNIYVTYDGQVKLGDFGIARVSFLEAPDDGLLKGKVGYMPPEVLVGEPVDAGTDLWSLSVSLYEMLTARRLFGEASEADLMAGRFPRITPVHQLNSDIDSKLSAVLQAALSPRPKKRPQDAAELYRRLKLYMRDEGVQVDSTALARFIAAVIGRQPRVPEPKRDLGDSRTAFPRPSFQVPLVHTPTQRFLRSQRRRIGLPLLAFALGAAVVVLLALLLRPQVSPQSANAPVATVDPSGKPAASSKEQTSTTAVPRERPAVPSEMSIEFSEDLGEDFGRTSNDAAPVPGSTAHLRALMHKGSIEAKRGRFDDAERSFAEALSVRATFVPALLGRADVLIELRRYAEAEQLVRNAIQQAPRNARAHLLLGDVLWVQGKDALARAAYQRAIDLEPSGAVAVAARRILQSL